VGVRDRQAVAPAVHAHPPDHHRYEHYTHAHVHGSGPSPHHDHHSLTDIARYIERSALSREGKDRAVRLFRRLAEAEAAIHDMPVDSVHLHEVGAVDSIIDIVGAVYGMEWLGVNNVVASPLNVGSGTVTCAHGTFPVPAPATALLLRGVPVYAGRVAAELVTPTGALLITEYAKRFGPLPEMRIDVVGYGAGDRDFSDHPNVLRLLVGETASTPGLERIVVLECEIDDMNPQLFGPLMDALYAAGALEVFYAAVQMKKNRPGTLVTVIAPPDRREALAGKLFAETTTIGVRYQELLRERLEREIRILDTPVGPIRFKVATRDGRVLNAAPEFDDCAKAAAERGMSIKDVHAIAQKAWLDGN
jgi:pyridinium-3,5-bisthiocarboxylic acid mononucleotide nickel chelatase